MKKRFITIKKDDNGDRLDKIIPRHLKDLSRGRVRNLIAGGSVSVDGRRIRKNSFSVQTGQTIAVYEVPESPQNASTPPNGSVSSDRRSGNESSRIAILFEDAWYLAVSKPAGMPSEETLQGRSGTLPHVLATELGYGAVTIVHRLDMRTSGVMLISRKPAATKQLNRQFRERTVEKTYVALVHGAPADSACEIVSRIDRDPGDPRKYRSIDPADSGGKEAVTRFRVLARSDRYALLSIDILTGRTHQIRVHMAESGHPVAGDHLYGPPDDPAPRLMLHARSITFDCPRTGQRRTIEAPVPPVLCAYAGIDYPWQK
ncbi:MAG TPA: RluA family pseudouridine synthase [bacterium]|nr:RluA family pseudouridine synthase [bacterium]